MATKPKLGISVQSVTPKMAEEMLKKMISYNRPISKRTIDKYARSMVNGDWKITGEALIETDKGEWFNGQHRLHAITVAKIPIDMVIVTGVPHEKEVFEAIDCGTSRTPADFIGGEGQYTRPYAVSIQAALRLLWYHQKNELSSRQKRGIGPQEIMELFRKHPEVARYVEDYFRSVKFYGSVLPVSWVAFLLFEFAKKDKKSADIFMDRLITGTNLTMTSPIHQLREILLQDRMAKMKMPKVEKLKLVIVAWNAYKLNKRGVKIAAPKEFPKIQ